MSDSKNAGHLGVGMHSYAFHWAAARERRTGLKFNNAFEFFDYCAALGAGGVQVALGSRPADEAEKFQAHVEKSGLYLEGQTSLPREESDVARFEAEVKTAKSCGATLMRTAILSGRRYETFDSADAFGEFARKAWTSLQLAEPVVRRHGIRLAVENHKDWLVVEFVDLLRRLGSDHIGICVDVGNNIALLEDPMEVVDGLAPFALSTHLKDMAVEEYEDGFLLSEVPLGDGFLDLPGMIARLRKANPSIRFNLEMMTRDPLRIPCLTKKYWATMQNAPASRLARVLALVKQHRPKNPLPRMTGKTPAQQLELEDENVRLSLRYAREKLNL